MVGVGMAPKLLRLIRAYYASIKTQVMTSRVSQCPLKFDLMFDKDAHGHLSSSTVLSIGFLIEPSKVTQEFRLESTSMFLTSLLLHISGCLPTTTERRKACFGMCISTHPDEQRQVAALDDELLEISSSWHPS